MEEKKVEVIESQKVEVKREGVGGGGFVPQKIQAERDKVAYLFNESGKKEAKKNVIKEEENYKNDFMNNYKEFKEKPVYNEKSSNGFLTFMLFVLFVALGVAVYFAFTYYKKLNNQTPEKSTVTNSSFDSNSKIVETEDGKTWVSYDEKKVGVEVFYSESCGEDCSGADVLAFLQEKIPTLDVKKTNIDGSENKDLNYVPYFVFDESVAKTSFYSQAQDLFLEKDGKYVFDSVGVGFSVGKQLAKLSEKGFVVGDENADVTVIAITDFSSEKCAIAQPILDKLAVEFKGKVKFVYKVVTNTEDEKIAKISSASFCADKQKGFADFSSLIFARQKNWIEFKGDLTSILEGYAASLKLDKEEFSKCLVDNKFEEEVKKMNAEIKDFGITGVPVYFVNDERVNGVVTYESLKAMISKALTSNSNSSNSSSDDSSENSNN